MTHNIVEKLVIDGDGRVMGKQQRRVRQGPLRMSSIEERAKPVMTPLILGDSFSLSLEACRAIAEWVALKVMITEYEHHDETDHIVTLQADRTAFYESRQIPNGYRIWIAYTDVEAWREQLFRFTGHLATLPIPDSRPTKQNLQTITLGIGQLLIQVIAAESERIINMIGPEFFDPVRPLWPLPGEGITWPPERGLTASEIDHVSALVSQIRGGPSPAAMRRRG